MSFSRSIYEFQGVRIGVLGLCQESHACLVAMGLLQTQDSSTDGNILLKETKSDFEILENAIRTHYNDGRKASEYEHGEKKIFSCPKYMLCLDPQTVNVELSFRCFDQSVADVFEAALRWIIKLNFTKQDVQYFPGSLVKFKEKELLIAGHGELGALDVVRELCRQGGKHLSQGVLLKGKHWQSMPGARAAKAPLADELSALLSEPSAISGKSLNKMIVVNRWQNNKSLLRPIESEEALKILWHLHRRSYEYFWPYKEFSQYADIYRVKVQALSVRQFLLGRDSFFGELENLF